jgi:ATP-dependent Clp protease ATP-binding subunit ClpA
MIVSNLLMQSIQQHVVGQEYAVAALARAATLAMAGVARSDGPLAVLLFLGPAGSSKTHVARSFARVITGNEGNMIRVDCQRLGQDTDQLSGPDGRLGLEHRRSSSAVRRSLGSFDVILFERIDETLASLRESLSWEIERGEFTTPGGYCSLHNSFVILTASLSKKKTDQLIARTIGFFRDGEADIEMPRRHLIPLQEMDNMFGARLVNQIDEIIIFDRPNEQNLVTLFERQLSEIERRLAGYSIGFMIDQDARAFLIGRSLEDLAHGMRQLKRAVRNHLEFPIADLMLSRQLMPGTTVVVKHESPRSFLNFQILVPNFATGQPNLLRPQTLRAGSIG